MSKAVWGARVLLSLALAGAVALSSCSETIRTGQSSSYLVLNSLQGGPGESGTLGSTLASDVLSVNEDTGRQTIFSDRGQATFQLVMKDAGGPGPSDVNSITITRYRVEYLRSDGRNTPGVDVPYGFDGAVTVTVSSSGGSTGFTLVRIQAKLEAPLAALAFGGGAKAISTIARVTFYGQDQTGREVSVTGNIDVNFADWAG
jgi:hypothetical protein